MASVVRTGTVLALLVALSACNQAIPTSPSPTIAQQTVAEPPATFLPPLSGPSRTFAFARQLSYPVQRYTENSRFVLFENGAFILEYLSLGGGYRGWYKETDGVINFAWEGWSAAGPWGASGEITGDTLTVRYNTIMSLSDFDDAVYVK